MKIRIHNKKHFVHVLKSECNLKNVIWQISHINRIKLFFDNRSANINGTQRTGLSRAKHNAVSKDDLRENSKTILHLDK